MKPRPAATLLMVRPGDRGPEVLMVRRPSRGFFGGLWVFPGGAIDEGDDGPLAHRVVRAGPETLDFPWRAAALRETVEEVGLVVTGDETPVSLPLTAGVPVFEAVFDKGLTLDSASLRLLSQWVTPRNAPVRFDARFYLTVAGGDPAVTLEPTEVVDFAWASPDVVLGLHRRGEWPMVTPTVHHLRWMSGFSTVETMWEAAAALPVETIEPVVEADGSEIRVTLPAGAGPA